MTTLDRAYGSYRAASKALCDVRWWTHECNVCADGEEHAHVVGRMATPELAAECVAAHNARLQLAGTELPAQGALF